MLFFEKNQPSINLDIFKHIKPSDIIAITEYGSFVYGTNDFLSDRDYVVIVKDTVLCDDQYKLVDGDYNIFWETQFQTLLNRQCIAAIEPFFTVPIYGSMKQYTYSVDPCKLRVDVSQRSSNSYVKCKKKLTCEEGAERAGMKSLFHSLRMLEFGYQLATTGRINHFNSANHFLTEIYDIGPNWEKLKEYFQPIYNTLSSKFKEVAPKEVIEKPKKK